MRNKKNLLVKKTNAEYTEYSAYTADGKLLYVERSLKNGTDELTEYIWAGSTLWAEKRTAGTESAVYYHHTDYHGSTEAITDKEKVVVWKAGYDAYGNVLEATGEMEFEASFTGKMFDKDSGLYYFNARWYDSELGRFTTPDPARDGVNWLVYCAANPVGRWDPSGLIQYPILSSTTMQQIEDSRATLNGSNLTIAKSGCAVAAIANMLSMSLEKVNNKYVKDGNLQWQKVADEYGWQLERVDGSQFTKVIYDKQNNNKQADFYTIVNVNYTPDGEDGDHWVGVQSVITKNNIDYIVIAASSDNDSSITSGLTADRKGRGWLLDKLGNILVPVTETKGYRTFYKGDTENTETQTTIPKEEPKKDPKTRSFLASIFNWGDEE